MVSHKYLDRNRGSGAHGRSVRGATRKEVARRDADLALPIQARSRRKIQITVSGTAHFSGVTSKWKLKWPLRLEPGFTPEAGLCRLGYDCLHAPGKTRSITRIRDWTASYLVGELAAEIADELHRHIGKTNSRRPLAHPHCRLGLG